MVLIKAFVKTFMAHDVLVELENAGVTILLAIDVKAMGKDICCKEKELSAEYGLEYSNLTKIELICSNSNTKKIMELIKNKAQTGHQGDGLLVVSKLEKVEQF